MVKQWEREYKKKQKAGKIILMQKMEYEEKFISDIIHAKYKAERQAVTDHNNKLQDKHNFMTNFKYPEYRLYLIVWDIIHNDMDSIATDYHKGKFTITEISNMIDIIPVKLLDYNKDFIMHLITEA